MAAYVISDIHGQYDMFMELLDKIKLKEPFLYLSNTKIIKFFLTLLQ